MLRGFLLGAGLFLAALLASLSNSARADDTAPAAADAATIERIEQLALELDADEFRVREAASEALTEIGEAARARLIELADNPPSPEVKVRAGKILWALDLAEIRRNAVKLDDFYEHVRQANAGKLDNEKFEQLLERLLVVLREATDNDTLKAPVQLAGLKRRGVEDRFEEGTLIVGSRGRFSSVRNSIVLADVTFNASTVDNSIIIARTGVNISSVENSIIIAGYDIGISSCRNGSIVLSSGVVTISSPKESIIGAGENADISLNRDRSFFVNTVVDEHLPSLGAQLVKTDGLILPSSSSPADNPLADKIVVTAALDEVVIFRRKAKGGEFVARLDKPIEHPDGGELPETAGWKVCYTSQRGRFRNVIFSNGDRFVSLPIVRP